MSWAAFNSVQILCAVYGLFYHVAQAENVLLFLVWTGAVLSVATFYNNEEKLKMRAKGRPVPAWLSMTPDFMILLALASVGRFFSATAMTCRWRQNPQFTRSKKKRGR
jgi:hypothetical protein